MTAALQTALAALGTAPLTEASLREHIHRLFQRVLNQGPKETYLANHSLGRPLDAMASDLAEGAAAWYSRLDDAWMPWWNEMTHWRTNTAQLLGAARPDCIVPKTSAGQGLRAVLNHYDNTPRVLSTTGEFDSIDHILKQYQARNRAEVQWVGARDDGRYAVDDLIARLDGIDLVVVSHVFFATGQVLADVEKLIDAAHTAGARVMLDLYHSYGVIPVDIAALGADYAIAGSYKYLRGGPGVCWLYVAPQHLADGAHTLDTGWFAKREPFAYARPVPPEFAEGGDAWMESTFNPLGFYQARSGLALVSGLGVARLRAYSLAQKRALSAALAARGIDHFGADAAYGAYVTIPHADPMALAKRLHAAGINGDARSAGLRLCPDILTTSSDIEHAATVLHRVLAQPTA
ncbi:aminotransferase class V-fold PLP-dependent enzyme [Chitinimonas sp. BJYL2]|uniref:aminotransferase class V-fold PLP-dependent enzyme n=1 Tax=Chitinimonas sp. BJYL2 TaxID=2976696 RepID=UPI0022B3C7B0|nr:aminotransferase class V-fold PLP-dependent enzyme [Chitinimonas sp. BJYL2]